MLKPDYPMRRLAILALALLLLAALPHRVSAGEKPIVVVTTSVLESIVRDLAGDYVEVLTVIPPNICPAHYDLRPGDVEIVRRASLVLAHGVEPWIRSLMESSGTSAKLIYIKGGWNTPELARQRYSEVARAIESELGIKLSDRLSKCMRAINETESELKRLSAESGFIGTPVVAMAWQKDFVSFLGFDVVASFKPPEMVTPQELSSVMENATKRKALLVIDNIQSGVDLGNRIARELGVKEVALSNFPGVPKGVNNLTEMMKYNANLLKDALSQRGVERELESLRVALYVLIAFVLIEAVVIAALWRRKHA